MPIDLRTARAIVTASLKAQMDGLDGALEFMESMPLFERLGGLAGGGVECVGAVPVEGDSESVGECSFVPARDGFDTGMKEAADELARIIEEYVLVESQVNRFSDTDIELRLKPDVFCAMFDVGEVDGGEGLIEADSGLADTCRDFLQIVPVYLHLESYWEDSLYIDVSIGEYRVAAFGFQTFWDMFSLNIDLGALSAAADAANALLTIEGSPMYDSLQAGGWLYAWIGSDYQGSRQLGVSVTDNTEIRIQKGDDVYRLAAAVSSLSLYADGTKNSARLVLDAKSLELDLPYHVALDFLGGGVGGGNIEGSGGVSLPEYGDQESVETEPVLDGPGDATGTLRVRCDGATLVAQTVGDIGVAVEGAGLRSGYFQISRDWDSLFGVQVLPAPDGRFDAMVGVTDAGEPLVGITSGAGLLVDWNLHEIEADLSEVPTGVSDETWTIAMQGNAPSFAIMTGRQDQWIRVVSGELTAGSNGVPGAGFSAGAGDCVRVALPEDDSHVLLGSLESVDCL